MSETTMVDYGIRPPADKTQPTHYVNNAGFHSALVQYKEQRDAAIAEGKDIPRIPEYIGACFLKIAEGLGQKHNFRNYSYLDDMIQVGVLTCVKNMNSFDTSRGTSAFQYFTQVVWYSFLGTIKRNKAEEQARRDMFFKGSYETYSLMEADEDFNLTYNDFINDLGKDDIPHEPKPIKAKKPKVGAIDLFI